MNDNKFEGPKLDTEGIFSREQEKQFESATQAYLFWRSQFSEVLSIKDSSFKKTKKNKKILIFYLYGAIDAICQSLQLEPKIQGFVALSNLKIGIQDEYGEPAISFSNTDTLEAIAKVQTLQTTHEEMNLVITAVNEVTTYLDFVRSIPSGSVDENSIIDSQKVISNNSFFKILDGKKVTISEKSQRRLDAETDSFKNTGFSVKDAQSIKGMKTRKAKEKQKKEVEKYINVNNDMTSNDRFSDNANTGCLIPIIMFLSSISTFLFVIFILMY